MADKKISQLTAASTPLDGTEVLPIVQSGSTVKVPNNDLRPKQIQSNATSGVLQIVGPAAASTRVMTVPDANFTAARTDAAQTFTGVQTFGTTVQVGSPSAGISYLITNVGGGKSVGNGGTLTYTMGGNYTAMLFLSNASSGRSALLICDGVNTVTTVSDPNGIIANLPVTKATSTITVTNNTGSTQLLYLTIIATS